MSFDSIYRIAGSAMNAQTVRLNTVASNLANTDSAANNAADVYQARKPMFAAVYENNSLTRGVGLGGEGGHPLHGVVTHCVRRVGAEGYRNQFAVF